MQQADIIVIGGGIAGFSIAAKLAVDASVILLEAETQPGYHATGRSAAYFAPAYGNQSVRQLTAAGDAFYRHPPNGFSEARLLRPRPAVFVATTAQQESVQAMKSENAALETIDEAHLRNLVPILRPGGITTGLLDVTGGDLDVDAILQGFIRQFRNRQGNVVTSHRVRQIDYQDGWVIDAEYAAPIVVNAAGAWADNIAELAGLAGLGLVPKRRTAVLVDPPVEHDITDWPLVIDIDEEFYFKPDAGKLLISPADETPSDACDAAPDEIDIAIAIDRVQAIANLDVRRIGHRWAGLRTFAPDKSFVAGFDPRAAGFFWLAGQGGYGVQSAPGLSELAWHLITGSELSGPYAQTLGCISQIDPARLIQ